mmetsp:Transcript_38081/g.91395  ORF Transcript_38081/g.91395 Transcript_38081/m.91395 type:complete len:947 (+) Transcript_38081:45-2885(+)
MAIDDHHGKLEKMLYKFGVVLAQRPWMFIAFSILLIVGCASGVASFENEIRQDKLWVPTGAVSLDQSEYVDSTWPASGSRAMTVWIPKDGKVFGADNLRQLEEFDAKIRSIVVDGTKVVADKKSDDEPEATYEIYKGLWAFDAQDVAEEDAKSRCSTRGGRCEVQSILGVFGEGYQLAGKTDAQILEDISAFHKAPMNTRVAATDSMKSFDLRMVVANLQESASGGVEGGSALWNAYGLNDRPAPFQEDGGDMGFEDAINTVWDADALCHLGMEEDHRLEDDVAKYTNWQGGKTCSGPDRFKVSAVFSRSFGDLFGDQIQGDLAGLGISFALVIAFLFLMIGPPGRDSVHGMISLGFVAVVIVGAAVQSGFGVASYIGVKNNPLGNFINFLILGLGVDDAFVITAEFVRHKKANKGSTIEDLIGNTLATGGASVFLTSFTDAAAFAIGASSKLPALRDFCIMAALSVFFTWFLMMILFTPALALHARRITPGEPARQRYDCCCCPLSICTAPTVHDIDEPKGCCMVCPQKGCTGRMEPLPDALEAFAKAILTTPGKIVTFVVFGGVLIFGIIGLNELYVNWKLEWFFPSDSYVADFFDHNEQYFSSGTRYSIHTGDTDVYDNRDKFERLDAYSRALRFNQDNSVSFFWADFVAEVPTASSADMQREQFYTELHKFYSKTTSCGTQGAMRWEAESCELCPEDGGQEDRSCSVDDLVKGVRHTRGSAIYRLEDTSDGLIRYETMTETRDGMKQIFGSELKAFPYSRDFATWEEAGIIEQELIQNLLFAGVVIIVVVFGVIQDVKVSAVTVVSTCMVILETAGILHFWEIRINGVFTINMVICVGLAVDYAAHIGHCFKHSYGTSHERALKAVRNLGPSVFNAVISTLLAVVVVGFSQSFVFRVFFRILCILCIVGGAHGLWLLPVVLSIVGGDAVEDASKKTSAVEPA